MTQIGPAYKKCYKVKYLDKTRQTFIIIPDTHTDGWYGGI